MCHDFRGGSNVEIVKGSLRGSVFFIDCCKITTLNDDVTTVMLPISAVPPSRARNFGLITTCLPAFAPGAGPADVSVGSIAAGASQQQGWPRPAMPRKQE
jgi:hypothetical protein